jgi:cysteine desulfurase
VTTESPIYLDFNATTPIEPDVVEAMLPFLREHFGNPSSSHALGLKAKRAVDTAREKVAALIGAEPDEIIFTSGGTEANNLAISGAVEASGRKNIVTSAIEHPSVGKPALHLKERGRRVDVVGVDDTGRVRAIDVGALATDKTALVTVMHANNETGALQPIAEIAALAKHVGAIVHTDAAQSAGKVPVRVSELGVDLMTIAGHKLYAPKGVGALYIRRGTELAPLMLGAGHERGLRPGTENVASIVGLGVACEIAERELRGRAEKMRVLTDRLLAALVAEIPALVRNGPETERLPNTLNVSFPKAVGSKILRAAHEVYASTGSACHEAGETPSAVLVAMGCDEARALGAVRLTVGAPTTVEEVDSAARVLVRAWKEVREPDQPV